jgi:circadian clock protein KaiB
MKVVKSSSPCPAASGKSAKVWRFHLYVSGRTSKSLAAYANLKSICERSMLGGYRITVIDIAERPKVAKADQVCATPMVIRRNPRPIRTVIGTLSDPDLVLVGLDIASAI